MIDLKYDRDGLIPAVVQDACSGRVLMLACLNRESLELTLSRGETWFYSRSRRELWHKGATSGHTQKVISVEADCDGDALLLRVEQQGPACHTGAASCFFRPIQQNRSLPEQDFLYALEAIIASRRAERPEGSYVAGLFNQGLDRILKKITEEAGEVVIAAKNSDRSELVYEAGDLLFHLLVALSEREIALSEVVEGLARRHGKRKEQNND